MSDTFFVLWVVLSTLAVADIVRKIHTETARVLWILCALIPVAGALYWYHVQYNAPAMKRLG